MLAPLVMVAAMIKQLEKALRWNLLISYYGRAATCSFLPLSSFSNL
jgi:hypothetical protein